jgi:type II secretory pathway pseudopilin PulG
MQIRLGKQVDGFTLAEVIVSAGIAVIALGGIIYGYILSAQRAEWSAYSLAAQSLAMQRLEQTRAAKWDPSGYPPDNDHLTSNYFPIIRTNILDIPITRTNFVYATNTTTISTISTSPPLRMIRVDCTWSFPKRGAFTNTVMCYRAAISDE